MNSERDDSMNDPSSEQAFLSMTEDSMEAIDQKLHTLRSPNSVRDHYPVKEFFVNGA